jgi:F-type H+-transporting ATPase subunit gamma
LICGGDGGGRGAPGSPRLPSTTSNAKQNKNTVKARIKSVVNIEKITSAMKLVAAAKLKKSQLKLEAARDFSKSLKELWPTPDASKVSDAKPLVVALTTDRGLCGGVNSSVIREIKATHPKDEYNLDTQIMVLGEKGRGALERLYKNHFVCNMGELNKTKELNFTQVLHIAGNIVDKDFSSGYFVYNKFKNMLTFETTKAAFYPYETAVGVASETFSGFLREGDMHALRNLHEFSFAVNLFGLCAETDASELSARMNAMGNSSKNAGEMIEKLNLEYNRSRQARSTFLLLSLSLSRLCYVVLLALFLSSAPGSCVDGPKIRKTHKNK